MVSVAVLMICCCCCLYVRPALATPAFLRQPSSKLVSSSANYVTQEVHWFSQRLDHFTSQVGQSVTHHSCIPIFFNFSHWLFSQAQKSIGTPTSTGQIYAVHLANL